MGIPRKQKPSPAEGEFLFQLDPEPLEECVTAYAGIPLFLQAARSLDVPGRVKQHLQIKQRQRGLDEAGYVESFLVLNALGGECLEDFERLREDEGLAEMLGHDIPSSEAARKFLYQFHDEDLELENRPIDQRVPAPRAASRPFTRGSIKPASRPYTMNLRARRTSGRPGAAT
jgi:hypothetical protein